MRAAMRGLSRWAFGSRRLVSSLGATEVAVKVRGAPISSRLDEGYGVVEGVGAKVSSLTVNDVVFVKGSGDFDEAVFAEEAAIVAESAALKLPPDVPPALAASLSSACAAYDLLRDVGAGDVVVHVGGETPIGQFAAQFAEARGAKLVSLVSPEVMDFDETVDLLKNLGALVAAPADYALWPGFRDILTDLGPPSVVIVDTTPIDTEKVNILLDAAKTGKTSSCRAAFRQVLGPFDDQKVDVRDAKVIHTILAMAKPGARLETYDLKPEATAPLGSNFSPYDVAKPVKDHALVKQVTAAANDLHVFAEAYDEGQCVGIFFVEVTFLAQVRARHHTPRRWRLRPSFQTTALPPRLRGGHRGVSKARIASINQLSGD